MKYRVDLSDHVKEVNSWFRSRLCEWNSCKCKV